MHRSRTLSRAIKNEYRMNTQDVALLRRRAGSPSRCTRSLLLCSRWERDALQQAATRRLNTLAIRDAEKTEGNLLSLGYRRSWKLPLVVFNSVIVLFSVGGPGDEPARDDGGLIARVCEHHARRPEHLAGTASLLALVRPRHLQLHEERPRRNTRKSRK